MIGRPRRRAPRDAIRGMDVTQEAAVRADGCIKGVGREHQPLEQEHGSAIGDQAVSLHLSQAQAAVAGPALGGLAGEDDAGAAGAGVDFVGDLMIFLPTFFFSGVRFSFFRFRKKKGVQNFKKKKLTMCLSFW